MRIPRKSLATVTAERRRIASGTIVLDFTQPPPGVNNLFATGTHGRRFVSENYKNWRDQAGLELMAQRPACAIGPVHVLIQVQEPKRPTDIDGKFKALLDLLVTHGIIDGDHNKTVRKVSAEWSDAVIGARVEIRRAA